MKSNGTSITPWFFHLILTTLFCLLTSAVHAQAPATTTVQDTVYKSDGSLASGSVVITWPPFISADSKSVLGGSKTVNINAGALQVALVPNAGATPSGTSYDVKYYQSTKIYSQETWVVPSSQTSVTLSQVRVNGTPTTSTMLAPSQITGSAIVSNLTATQTITAPATAGVIPLRLKGNSTANANVLEIYDSQATPQLQSLFDPAGALISAKAPTFSPMTQGSIQFAGPGGLLSQDNANLFWDNTNKRFGIGTFSPTGQLHLGGAGQAITNNYGLLVDNKSAGTNNWNIWSGTRTAPSDLYDYSHFSSNILNDDIALGAGGQHITSTATLNVNDASTGTAVAILGQVTTSGPGAASLVVSNTGQTLHNGTGSIARAAGIVGYVENDSSGVISNAYSVWAQQNANWGSGQIINNIGINVDDQAGGGTNNWAIKTGTGLVEFGDQVLGKNINFIRYANQFSGANAGAKIAAAIVDLPSTGGTVDASGLQGSQTISTDVFSSVTISVTVIFGAGTYAFSLDTSIPKNITVIMDRGAALAPASGKILTINGKIEAPCGQPIFSGSGTIVYGENTPEVCAEWHGFGTANTGANNQLALQAAVTAAAGRLLRFASTGVANVEGTIAVPSNSHLRGNGTALQLMQTSASAVPLFHATGASNVVFDNLYLYGTGVWTNGNTNGRDAIFTSGSTNVSVLNNTIRNFGGIGIYLDSGTDFLVQGNVIEGTWVLGVNSSGQGCDTLKFCQGAGYAGEFGIFIGDITASSGSVIILGNTIYNELVGIDGGSDASHATVNWVVSDNIIHDIMGQHCFYVGGENLVVSGNTCSDAYLDGIKAVDNSTSPAHIRSWSITGNTILRASGNGMTLELTSGTIDLTGIGVTGNTLVGGGGIAVRGVASSPNGEVIGGLISNNTFSQIVGTAVKVDDYVSRLKIDGNLIDGTTENSIWVNDAHGQYIDVTNNTIYDGGVVPFLPIMYEAGTNGNVSDNTVIDTRGGSAANYGIYVSATPAPTLRLNRNYVRGEILYNVRLDAAVQSAMDNDWNSSINNTSRVPARVIDQALSLTGVLTSTVATGTAPLSVASTTAIANLNADMVDGLHGSSLVPTTTTVNGHALSGNVSVTASDVGLGSVENTALSTWAGSSNITTLGTITVGTFPYGGLSGVPSTFAPSAHNLLSTAHGDTAVASPVLGDLLYGNSTPAWGRLAGQTTTTKKFLSQTGNGSVSAAPSWVQPACADLSNGATGCSTTVGTAATHAATDFATAGAAVTGGVCTNQAATAISANGVPTCTTLTSTYVDGSIITSAASQVLNHPTIGISGTAASSHVLTVGTAPSCVFSTGGGTTPSCALETGSTDYAGTMTIGTGTGSPGSSGTITLTFNATMGTNSPVCVTSLTKGATDWSVNSTVRITTQSTTAPVFSWLSASATALVTLATSTNYKISYICIAK